MISKGFKFGMLLQLAVGPMCLMVFNTASANGFLKGLLLVSAIALIDGLYITLSGLGIAAVLNKNRVKLIIKLFGCIVLVLFGVNILLDEFGYSLLPSISLFSNVTGTNTFLQGLLLTASNPLTIIFWSGVFSTQVIEHEMNKKQLFVFGAGCVLSTLVFLILIAICGSILSSFLPPLVIRIMNLVVGFVLVYFGIRLLVKKQ